MNERIETGACFCGGITAEIRGKPFWICFDHDDDCRRAIGSPLNVWVGVRPDQFVMTKGTPKKYSRTKGVTRTFCPKCGTSIGYLDEGLKDELYVTIGFFDHPERLQPEAHAYWDSKLPWIEFGDKLPHIEEYSRIRNSSVGNPKDRGRS